MNIETARTFKSLSEIEPDSEAKWSDGNDNSHERENGDNGYKFHCIRKLEFENIDQASEADMSI